MAPTQFSAADTVRVVHEAVDQTDLNTIEALTVPDVHYRRLHGRELNLPCRNVFRVSDGPVRYRIATDVNPVIVVGADSTAAVALALYGVNPNFALTV